MRLVTRTVGFIGRQLSHTTAASYNCDSTSSTIEETFCMAKLGFLGLGLMGYPMARNLLRAGHDVALWSHTTEKAKELAQTEKGKFCETPKQVGEHAECIFLCVGDTEMSERVILGDDGIQAGAKG